MDRPEGPRQYRFSAFFVDADERRLERGGQEIPLPRKVFDLLQILVENAGRLQTREELISALWPGKVVEEQGLTTRIHTLRRVLDDAGGETCIETVRGVGYRFTAPVRVIDAEDAPPPNTAFRLSARQWAAMAVALAALIVAVLFIGWRVLVPPGPAVVSANAEPSIAVLPFQNLSSDPGNAYFAAGIQDEILTRLASLGGIKVIARTSSARFGKQPPDLHAVGRQLGVATVLEGSVQKAGDEVHVNVQLIDTHSLAHIWAHSYNRKLSDMFAVEGEVAGRIANALSARLEPGETVELAKAPTRNRRAYLAYLKANYLDYRIFASNSVQDPAAAVARAAELYRQATTDDPDFALAWARLAILEINAYWFGDGDAAGRLASATHAAARAIALAPDAPRVQLAMGYVEDIVHHNNAAALEHYQRALAKLPHDPEILARIAFIHRKQGHWLQALDELRQATVRDPRNPRRHYEIAVTLTSLRRYAEADQALQEALAIEPLDYEARSYRVRVLLLAGHLRQARKVLAEFPPGIDPEGAVSGLRFWSAWLARQPQQAVTSLEHAPEWVVDPATLGRVPASLLRGQALALAGQPEAAQTAYADARKRLQAALQATPGAADLNAALGRAEADLGEAGAALAAGRKATQLQPVTVNALYGTSPLAALAAINVHARRSSHAIAIVRQLLSMPAGGMLSVPLLRIDPTWDPLRSKPQFSALLTPGHNKRGGPQAAPESF